MNTVNHPILSFIDTVILRSPTLLLHNIQVWNIRRDRAISLMEKLQQICC
jgi:hypothetical protein